MNPVEKVRIPTPVAGNYTIRVRAAGRDGPAGLRARRVRSAQPGRRPVFTPGAAQQRNAAGDPTISNVVVTPVSSDLAKVTFATSEPTTALVRANVGGSSVDYVDSYNLGFDGYKRSEEGPIGCAGTQASSCVETSAAYANKPVLGTRHEVLVTGSLCWRHLQPAAASDRPLGSLVTDIEIPKTTASVFAPVADDIAQYASADTDAIDPEIIDGTGRRTATQLYAGQARREHGRARSVHVPAPDVGQPGEDQGRRGGARLGPRPDEPLQGRHQRLRRPAPAGEGAVVPDEQLPDRPHGTVGGEAQRPHRLPKGRVSDIPVQLRLR